MSTQAMPVGQSPNGSPSTSHTSAQLVGPGAPSGVIAHTGTASPSPGAGQSSAISHCGAQNGRYSRSPSTPMQSLPATQPDRSQASHAGLSGSSAPSSSEVAKPLDSSPSLLSAGAPLLSTSPPSLLAGSVPFGVPVDSSAS